ncbi:ABC transporter substrate-binding protein [Pseudonocardia nematodicida]|uniref:ABC transporter substrate-binding protein n=1 Tax=Pseudonocardia nematodicida TaxID=1206997 RepID=A0ABV1K4S7_9PSEU
MNTRRRTTLSVLAVALSGVLLAACGAAPALNEGEGGAGGVQAVNPNGVDPATEGEPRAGGTLVLGTDREAVGFDPTAQNTNQAAFAVLDSLMKLTPDGGAEPHMAESMDSADDGKTWRMGLREGVRFSDGTPVDADAVVFNVQRHLDKPASPGFQHASLIETMRAVDPTTVEFVLREPSGSFPVVFGLNFTAGNLGALLSPAAVQERGDDIAANPVGAGPFVLSDWVRDSRMVLTANPDYWQEGRPYLDGLEFRPLPDTETRYASIENGDVNVVYGGYHTELIRALSNPELNVYYGPGHGAEFIYFNHERAPFDDPRMREAFVRGIDLDALAATQFRNQMERATGWFGDQSEYQTPEAAEAWPAFDQERARELVQEYVDSGGSATVSYKTTNAPNRVAFAEFMQAQMAAIGITLEPEFFDLAQYSSSVVQSRDFEAAGWVGGPTDSPYPQTINYLGTGGNANYGGYSNPEVDELLTRAAATTDEAERTESYRRVQLLTNQDIPVGYYSRGYLSTITQPDVRGIQRYLSRDMFFDAIWLDR